MVEDCRERTELVGELEHRKEIMGWGGTWEGLPGRAGFYSAPECCSCSPP